MPIASAQFKNFLQVIFQGRSKTLKNTRKKNLIYENLIITFMLSNSNTKKIGIIEFQNENDT